MPRDLLPERGAIAAITGLAAEARIARSGGLFAEAAGSDPAGTRAACERLLASGVSGLVSFGIAGGLDPALAPGTLLLARAVLDENGERFPVDEQWHSRVLAILRGSGVAVAESDVLGAALIVSAKAAKAELHRRTGAGAVDLESHIGARAAARAGRPFLIFRVIADPAALSLPPAAAIGLDAAGRPALGRVLVSVAGNPGQIPALLRLARDTRTALKALASNVAVWQAG